MKNRLTFKEPDGTWIPASETKPPIGKNVIATLWDGNLSTARWYGDRWQIPYRYTEDVVAWMEIEPYKAED